MCGEASEDIEDLMAGEERKGIPDSEKPVLVHEYFDRSKHASLAKPASANPMNKGFDIRSFRLRQAA